MKSVSSKIYTKDYFYRVCLGSQEFKKSKGKMVHPTVKKLLDTIPLSTSMTVLDAGCGRGDTTAYLAKKVKKAYGIDYSKDAIEIANELRESLPDKRKKSIQFKQANIKKTSFQNNTFDVIVCIDIFEHLYKEELAIAMKEVKRILKPDGLLFVHTGVNKLLYDVTYPWYIYPVNRFLTWIDMHVKKTTYPSFSRDPRSIEEKEQHVNEPTYFYLQSLFRMNGFRGSIKTEIGFRKEGTGLRTYMYNFLLTLYPLSKLPPLSYLFGWAFICNMRNSKLR